MLRLGGFVVLASMLLAGSPVAPPDTYWETLHESSGDVLNVGGQRQEDGQSGGFGHFPDGLLPGGIDGFIVPPLKYVEDENANQCVGQQVAGCTRLVFRPIAVTPEEAEEIEPGLPVITINDLAIFMPAKPEGVVEPDVAGVTGMPVNVVGSASQHIRTGTLFEYPVQVEFTPSGFRFSFGDGATLDASTGGASWEALGQAEFTPTATSHVYAARGTYSASVDVSYTARVNFGTGWIVVPGTLTATNSLGEIRIVDVATGLVDKTCIENPSGPGC